MIVTLTGAKKNVGDFLIGDRAFKLLKKYIDDDIVNLSRFESLDDKIDLINSSRAVFLCGGPAYRHDIYPGIYPLVNDLSKIKVPIIPFGLGWSGEQYNDPEKFEFSEPSRNFLQYIHENIPYSSCRDVITHSILKQHGIENVLLTGCPVWYNLDKLSKDFRIVKLPKKIVFSSGAKRSLFSQTLSLLRIVREKFPEAKIYFTFHRGYKPGKGTPPRSGLTYFLLAIMSKRYNVEVVDVSSDLSKINFYEDCDLHIGYRVHAHLHFISNRLPSYLINEDGRGIGMVKSLGQTILNYDNPQLIDAFTQTLENFKQGQLREFDITREKLNYHFSVMEKFLKGINEFI